MPPRLPTIPPGADRALGRRPLYRQVRALLTDRMIEGVWRPGQSLPSEMQLAAELGVSQGTVRKALDELVAQNLLVRRQGRGTFVNEHSQQRSLFHFFKLVSDRGEHRLPASRLLKVEAASAAPAPTATTFSCTLTSGVARNLTLTSGSGATATSFQDDWGYPTHAANLTESWTFRGGAAASDVFMRFRAGIAGTPMPSYKGTATDHEMWDLANYVASLRRTPVWEMSADEVTAFYREQEAEHLANPVKRGEYLVNILACPVCHSPADSERRTLPGMRLAGGLRMQLSPFGVYPTGNLTSDKETGLGTWSDEEIKRVLTKGTLRDGTRLLPFPMDWASFSTLPASDIDAIVAYLRTVPPVRNKVPRLTRTVLPLYLWEKFRMLVLGADLPSYFYAGNAGITSGAQR